MSIFQIVQMDAAAAKWLGFAKQQCKRIMDNGTKDFYREWPLGDATVKAKSYGGTVQLWLVAGGVVYTVSNVWGNPIQPKGLGAQRPIASSNYTQYVFLSDGTIIASLAEPPYLVEQTKYNSTSTIWNGGDSLWMMNDTGPFVFNSLLSFTVPPECISPIPPTTPPNYAGVDGLTASWNTYWATGVSSRDARAAAWSKTVSDDFLAACAGGFSASNVLVTNTAFKQGTVPTDLVRVLQSAIGQSNNTYVPSLPQILSGPTYVMTAYTITGNTAFTANFSCSVTIGYVDTTGTLRQQTVSGTFNIVGTAHLLNYSQGVCWSVVGTYTNFPGGDGVTGTSSGYDWFNNADFQANIWPHLLNYGEGYGTMSNWMYPPVIIAGGRLASYNAPIYGVLNGTYTASPLIGTSVGFTAPTTSGNFYATTVDGTLIDGVTPNFIPPSTGSVVCSSIQTVQDWVAAYPPAYSVDGSLANSNWNTSSRYKMRSAVIRFFGPSKVDGTQLGMFADGGAANGCTNLSVYGDLALSYDWLTDTFVFVSWKSRQILDSSGNPVLDSFGKPTYPVYPLPNGISYSGTSATGLYFAGLHKPDGTSMGLRAASNCAITYKFSDATWPDLDAMLKLDEANAKATLAYATQGTITPTAGFYDPVHLYVKGL